MYLVSTGFGLGYLLFVMWHIFAAHTVTYDPNNSSQRGFKNQYWVIYLMVCLCAVIPVFFVRFDAFLYGNGTFNYWSTLFKRWLQYESVPEGDELDTNELSKSKRKEVVVDTRLQADTCHNIMFIIGALFIIVLTIIFLFSMRANPNYTLQSTQETNITLMTFNIQNGNYLLALNVIILFVLICIFVWPRFNKYLGIDITGNRFYDEILKVLKDSKADIIALVNSDTNRNIFNNDDLVRYLADSMGYSSYYGPYPSMFLLG